MSSPKPIVFPLSMLLSTIAFAQLPPGNENGVSMGHLHFRVTDPAVQKKLLVEALGAKVLSENPGTRQMFIQFPDAIKIEFSEDKKQDKPVVHDHIHFVAPQCDEQRAWYEKTFGAKLGMTGRFKAADVPGVNLRWNTADRRLPGIKGTSVDHIGFEVANLETFCKKLEAGGVKFDLPYRSIESIGLRIAFLTDPWGVYIELTEGLAALDKKAQSEAP